MNAASFSLQVEQSLRNLGFTRHEVQVLLYLIRVKRSSAKKLSREAAIQYSMAKAVLSNLVRRDLVIIERIKDRDYYIFCGKVAFEKWLREEEQKHQGIYDQAGKDMEQFFEEAEQDQWKPEVLFYEGAEGITEIYDDMLKTGEDVYTCTNLEKLIDILGGDYIDEFIKIRKEKNIHLYTIRSQSAHDELSKKESMKANDLREVKIIKDLELDGEIKIYGEKSALITFEGGRPVGFVFSGGPTARLMKNFFMMQWNNL